MSVRRGVTLLETIAVVAILAMAACLGLISLAGSAEAGGLRRAATEVRDFDARVRALARSEREVELVMAADGAALLAQTPGDRDAILLRLDLPSGVVGDLSWTPADAAPVVERSGRSADYRVVLRGSGRAVGISVHGLTGQVIAEGE